jgi:hypothetical protein
MNWEGEEKIFARDSGWIFRKTISERPHIEQYQWLSGNEGGGEIIGKRRRETDQTLQRWCNVGWRWRMVIDKPVKLVIDCPALARWLTSNP